MRSRKFPGLVLAGLLIGGGSGLSAETAPVSTALVGPAVGNADVLSLDATRAYNKHQYGKAADAAARAVRADPARVPVYLLLARSYLGAKELRKASIAYRAYLKAAPASPEARKASSELEGCERKLRRAKKQSPDPSSQFVEEKDLFFHALEQGQLLGPGSAGEELRTLVSQGYLGVDLGDMANKLSQAAVAQAEALFKRSINHEAVSGEALKDAPALYQLATDTGAPPPSAPGRAAFLDGLGALKAQDYTRAERRFTDAAKAEPQVTEYQYYRAIALYRAGKGQSALQVLESELPNDSRTALLRTAVALDASPEQGATELERALFTRRFESGR